MSESAAFRVYGTSNFVQEFQHFLEEQKIAFQNEPEKKSEEIISFLENPMCYGIDYEQVDVYHYRSLPRNIRQNCGQGNQLV